MVVTVFEADGDRGASGHAGFDEFQGSYGYGLHEYGWPSED